MHNEVAKVKSSIVRQSDLDESKDRPLSSQMRARFDDFDESYD